MGWWLDLLLASPRLTVFLLQEAIIGGLQAETTYSVTVAAYTTKGDGARSKAKVITTSGAGQSLGRTPPSKTAVSALSSLGG